MYNFIITIGVFVSICIWYSIGRSLIKEKERRYNHALQIACKTIESLQKEQKERAEIFDKRIAWFRRNSIKESTTIKNLQKQYKELAAEYADDKRRRMMKLRRK